MLMHIRRNLYGDPFGLRIFNRSLIAWAEMRVK